MTWHIQETLALQQDCIFVTYNLVVSTANQAGSQVHHSPPLLKDAQNAIPTFDGELSRFYHLQVEKKSG